jgi:hypothetical protein
VATVKAVLGILGGILLGGLIIAACDALGVVHAATVIGGR